MSRPLLLGTASLAAAAAFGLALVARGLSSSQERLDAARLASATLDDDLERLSVLRQSSRRPGDIAPSESNLIERILSTLDAAGIAVHHFDGLESAGSAPVVTGTGQSADGPVLLRESTRVTLRGIELADLYFFLDRWRQDHTSWLPSRFEITQAKPASGSAAALRGGGAAVDARITLVAIRVETGG
ncbi:MAG TPA: hypothetical protein PKC43_10235 [Phycisphaerales bacterium]|nr:hypothetical protein [Phycisphaerales bacterium]HMP37814.1 hypothetical protein [Phycisphaerales bacterium]